MFQRVRRNVFKSPDLPVWTIYVLTGVLWGRAGTIQKVILFLLDCTIFYTAIGTRVYMLVLPFLQLRMPIWVRTSITENCDYLLRTEFKRVSFMLPRSAVHFDEFRYPPIGELDCCDTIIWMQCILGAQPMRKCTKSPWEFSLFDSHISRYKFKIHTSDCSVVARNDDIIRFKLLNLYYMFI